MSSRIEQVIGEIEDYIADCKYQTFSNTNIIVEKERIDELLRDLRMRTPDEIKRYQKIISNKEAILQDAREKADAMLQVAQAQTEKMVGENEIMQQAFAQAGEVTRQATEQAQQIVDMATIEANNIRQSAMEYTYAQLQMMQDIIASAIGIAESNYGELVARLRECDAIISNNRSQLYPQVELDNEIAILEGNANDQAGNVPVNNAGNAGNPSGRNAGGVHII